MLKRILSVVFALLAVPAAALHLGDYAPASNIDFKFNTRTAAGAPITFAGTPSLTVYKANGDVQDGGDITLTVDFDSITGMHHVRIDTSVDPTFYASGGEFQVVVVQGTVNGQSVAGQVVASFSLNNRSALRPTTAGRTLDVTATGEAGIDWANIGGPTTSVNLSGTTVGVVASVTAVGTDGITATSIATDAIGAAEVAASAIGASELATDAIGAAEIAADAVGASEIAADAIGSSELAADAITTSEIATGAVDADAVATDAADEIATQVWAAGTRTTTAGTITTVTGNVNGNVAGSVGSVAAGGITAASIATDAIDADALAADTLGSSELAASAVTEIQSGLSTITAADVWNSGTRTLTAFSTGLAVSVWDVLLTDISIANTIGTTLETNVDATTSSRLATAGYTAPPSVGAIADQVWDEPTPHSTTDTMGALLTAATAPSAATVADAVWDEALSGHLTAGTTGYQLNAAGAAGDPWGTLVPGAYSSGTAGYILGNRLDTAVSTRAAAGTAVTVTSPVAASGELALKQGDDYSDTDGRAITFTYTGGADLTAATARLKLYSNTGTELASYTATSLSFSTPTWTIKFEPTAAQTAVLVPGEAVRFDVEATLAVNGRTVTLTDDDAVVTVD